MSAGGRLRVAFALGLWLCGAAAPLAAQTATSRPPAPTPESFFGFTPGDDRRLADYDELCAYARALERASDRLRTAVVGRTTEGREFFVCYVSSAANLARAEEIRAANLRLADPATSAAEAASLAAAGKVVVFVNASIHSNEVGPAQATALLLRRLATADDAETRALLDALFLVVVPCHNPDGYAKQVAWYRSLVGTPYEGAPLPELYHRYVGHDNNRDWFLFTQVESRVTIDALHAAWRPQIVIDRHQMGEDGPRLFVPPYQAPIEPHVDLALRERLSALGAAIHADAAAADLTGVVSDALFDAWSPSRAYIHYHGGVRVLTEVASARTASPLENVRPRKPWHEASSRMPRPWPGGAWRLADVVRYDLFATEATLRHAARERERWLLAFRAALTRGAAPRPGLAGYLLTGRRGGALRPDVAEELRRVLGLGGLDYREPVAPDGAARAFFVPTGSPYFPFAEALFENVPYPTVVDDGVLRRPYDVTCHHLPTLMGFEARREAVAPPGFRPATPPPPGEDRYRPAAPAPRPGRPVAIYRSVAAVMDEGWLRYFCDRRGYRYESFDDDAMRARLVAIGADGAPRLRDDGPRLLIVPDLSRAEIERGPAANLPPRYRGGLGEAGATAVRDFLRAGGTVVAVKNSTAWLADVGGVPLRNAVAEASLSRPFNIPGSALRVTAPATTATPPARSPRFDEDGYAVLFTTDAKAFVVDDAAAAASGVVVETLARYADEDRLVLGGYAEGADVVAGKAALVRARVGRGTAYFFGFVPYFRYQTQDAFPLFEHVLDAVE